MPLAGYFKEYREHGEYGDGEGGVPPLEALRFLAEEAESVTGCSCAASLDARFHKTAVFPADSPSIPVSTVLESLPDGNLHARLESREPVPGAPSVPGDLVSVTCATDGNIRAILHYPPLEAACAAVGHALAVDADRLYSGLVPAGPAFRNLKDTVFLTPDGALATLVAPDMGPCGGPLGSPFVLEAAFQAARAWALRYYGVKTRVSGYAARRVHQPAWPKTPYVCRVFPDGLEKGAPRFDVFLYNEDGVLVDAAAGVRTQVVEGGAPVPDWAVEMESPDFSPIETLCRGFLYMDTRCLAPFAHRTLSREEREGAETRLAGRYFRCAAARVLVKQIVREALEVDLSLDAREIVTAASPGECPRAVVAGMDTGVRVSAAHSARYAAAVLDSAPVGVHVEERGGRCLQHAPAYMDHSEELLCWDSVLEPRRAAVRAWSFKKAAAKALGLPQTKAWRAVRIVSLGKEESTALHGSQRISARHVTAHNHTFTVVKI